MQLKVEQNQLFATDSGWQESLLNLPQQLRLEFYIVFKNVLVFEGSLFLCVCLTPERQWRDSLCMVF